MNNETKTNFKILSTKEILVIVVILLILLAGTSFFNADKDNSEIQNNETIIIDDNPSVKVTEDCVKLFTSDYHLQDGEFYYKNNKIEGVDAETFCTIDSIFTTDYTKDKNSVYYNGIKIHGMDPATFLFTNNDRYIKDKQNVYYVDPDYGVEKIEGSDSKTFERINHLYSRDENTTYYKSQIVSDGINASEYGDSNWSDFIIDEVEKMYVYKGNVYSYEEIDKLSKYAVLIDNSLFSNNNILEVEDVETFEVVFDNYLYKDSKKVYYMAPGAGVWFYDYFDFDDVQAGILEGIQPENIQGYDDYYFKLNDKIYGFNIYSTPHSAIEYVEGVDIDTFEVLSKGYSKDKDSVYHTRGKIKDANPDTFDVELHLEKITISNKRLNQW